MKLTNSLAVVAALASLAAIANTPAVGNAPAAPVQGTAAKESPFACDTLALDPVARKRHFDVLGPELVARRLAVRELPNGYEFTWSSDPKMFNDVVEWIGGEKACCPFFNFALNVAAEHGLLKLQVTGRPGTKAFMQNDGADWIKPIVASK